MLYHWEFALGAGARRREKGSGGIFRVGEDRWRVDVELPREPGQPRRRASRQIHGTYDDAQRELERLVPGAPPTVVFSVRMAEELASQVRAIAEEHGVSVAEEIRRAVQSHVNELRP